MMRGTLASLGLLLCCALAAGTPGGQGPPNACPVPRCPRNPSGECGGAAAGTCGDETKDGCAVKACTCVSGYKGGGRGPCVSEAAVAAGNDKKKDEAAAGAQREEQEKREKDQCTDLAMAVLCPMKEDFPNATRGTCVESFNDCFAGNQTLIDSYKSKRESACETGKHFCDKGGTCVPDETPLLEQLAAASA
ncbi:hypothetical protein T484DRAFT_1914938 [Baffinella frigidus]|nr:hypothetical protein T484DRAFT_1914938 [Cryptophyta sp. CCMP2293]